MLEFCKQSVAAQRHEEHERNGAADQRAADERRNIKSPCQPLAPDDVRHHRIRSQRADDAGAASGALASAIGSIPVLSVDTNVGIEGQTSFVGPSNVDAAKEGGLWAAEQAGEGANAVIIYGQEGDNTSNMRREGYQAACDEAGVTVLDALSGQNTTDGATKTMEDLLNAYPDQIDIVLCHNDDTAIGAMNACKSAGVDDMIIVGFDGNASAVDLILAGDLIKATVAQQPYEMGYQAVEAALKAINGETGEEVINAPVTVVTAENGQEYLDSLAAMQG